MVLSILAPGNPLWEPVAVFAESCSWKAGKKLAKRMRNGCFTDWERVFIAQMDGRLAGFCSLIETDCLPSLSYTPYISHVFVAEPYRGQRLSQQLIRTALAYAREVGFQQVYLISDHQNLYEKYGFFKVDQQPAPWEPGTLETVFSHTI